MVAGAISRPWHFDGNGAAVIRIIRAFTLCIVLASGLPAAASASVDFESLARRVPGDEYRQLSLLLLVAGGVKRELLDTLPPPEAAAGVDLSLDDYSKPLVRIADPEAMLASAARMMRFAQDNGSRIEARMRTLASEHPVLVSMVDVNEIAADAIIIRNAIADTIEYSVAMDRPGAAELLERFRQQTVHLRNMMEYNLFQEQLDHITDEAIVDLGGRLDAYQRMFNEQVDPEMVQRRIESAEIMNAQTKDRYQEQADAQTNEVLLMLILMESQVQR